MMRDHGGVLVIVDHASNHVPDEIDLGIDRALLQTHIAWDIGAAALAQALGYPMHLATVSRLVIDCNREADSPALIPLSSDGHAIPGNPGDRAARIERYWAPYHDQLAQKLASGKFGFLVSLHSFTPVLSSNAAERRPWQVGILYNRDDRAARLALPMLEAAGVIAGDQLPYSGKTLNATMNRHAEARGTPYLGIEMRQDLIADPAGVAHWANVLRPIIDSVAVSLA